MSGTHLVLIPSFDTGPTLLETVESALAQWSPVWVVIDGSSDGSARLLDPLLAGMHLHLLASYLVRRFSGRKPRFGPESAPSQTTGR